MFALKLSFFSTLRANFTCSEGQWSKYALSSCSTESRYCSRIASLTFVRSMTTLPSSSAFSSAAWSLM
jgi:hypothetical protein